MGSPILELKNAAKRFGETEVLNGISISVQRGEFVTLLGPSGCGKTTTLRLIAGLETPDQGEIYLAGENVTKLPPDKRDVNTIFQSYALFPHMNVEENVGYGLKIRRTPKAEIRRAVGEALRLVQLEGLEKRMPSQLSGGQKQRVAIARAIVRKPSVLLLDEPLGALDLQLRRKMQWELKNLQKQLGLTFIYITHDQEEALNMSDRIAVMRDGVFQQIGTPWEIYYQPRTSYVAEFVGEANILKARVEAVEEDRLVLNCAGEKAFCRRLPHDWKPGEPVTLAIRSESLELSNENGAGLPAQVEEKGFAGGMLRLRLRLEDGTVLTASRQGLDLPLEPGTRVCVSWKAEQAVPVDLEA